MTQVPVEQPFRSRALSNAIAQFEAMDMAFNTMLRHGLHGGPEYDFARDRFNALREMVRDRAIKEEEETCSDL